MPNETHLSCGVARLLQNIARGARRWLARCAPMAER